MPEWPYDVASRLGSMKMCVEVLRTVVVGNVTVDVGVTALIASEVRKTSAKPGAGTGIEHVLAVWSQLMDVTFSVPFRRPSEVRGSPSVCGVRVRRKHKQQAKKKENDIAEPGRV